MRTMFDRQHWTELYPTLPSVQVLLWFWEFLIKKVGQSEQTSVGVLTLAGFQVRAVEKDMWNLTIERFFDSVCYVIRVFLNA